MGLSFRMSISVSYIQKAKLGIKYQYSRLEERRETQTEVRTEMVSDHQSDLSAKGSVLSILFCDGS